LGRGAILRSLKNPLLIITLCSLGACSAEKTAPFQVVESAFRSGTVRNDVVFNLETAYETRNINEYDKLLDEDFIFHFSPADIRDYKVNVKQWDRAAELDATTNLFDRTYSPPQGEPVDNISVEFDYKVDEDDDWQPQAPSDPQKYPNETWYKLQVDYFLNISAGATLYTSGNSIRAEFTIRPVTVDGKQIWRIVSWRDDILG
jgi:hypothetical protein